MIWIVLLVVALVVAFLSPWYDRKSGLLWYYDFSGKRKYVKL